ncbi:MAG: trypsin-like serine protease [Promethearchaeota archaeon]
MKSNNLKDYNYKQNINVDIINSDKSESNTESVILPDDREKISPTTSMPWRSIVKLYMTFDGAIGIGSGAIIDDFHVLTAGHCVYDYDDPGIPYDGLGWARSIKVVPGKDGDYEPYGYAWVTKNETYSEWVSNGDSRYDMSLLTLDRNVGAHTGYMELGTKPPGDPIYTGFLNMTGYPGDLDNGEYMYHDTDVGHSADQYNHSYYMDTYGGQSGGPVWMTNASGDFILTIHAYGGGGSNPNFGTRLNSSRIEDINNWISADGILQNKSDLADRGEYYSGLKIDDEDLNVWCDVFNIGTNSTLSSFTVSFYLSDDDSITDSDYFLGSDTISPLSEYEYADSGWEGEIDEDDLDEGTYYIGWIIDDSGDINEIDETNNVGYVSDTRLKITDEDDEDDDYEYVFDLREFLLSPTGMFIIFGSIVAIIIIIVLIRRSHRV